MGGEIVHSRVLEWPWSSCRVVGGNPLSLRVASPRKFGAIACRLACDPGVRRCAVLPNLRETAKFKWPLFFAEQGRSSCRCSVGRLLRSPDPARHWVDTIVCLIAAPVGVLRPMKPHASSLIVSGVRRAV